MCRMNCVFSVLAVFFGGAASHALAADVCTSTTNLVTNCGFETGDFTGWTLSGTDSSSIYNGIYYGIANANQYSGTYAAYLGAVGGQLVLSQIINNTSIGNIYTVSFRVFNDTAADTGYINNFSATLAGTTGVSLSQSPVTAYALYSFQAGATSNSTVLSFSSRNDAGYWYLDSIQVVQTTTPEPSSMTMLFSAAVLLTVAKIVQTRKRSSGQRLL